MRTALGHLQDGLKAGRHVDEDDLHLTLIFLGDAGSGLLHELDMGLDMLRLPPLALRIAGLGTFGHDPPRSLHAVVDGGAALGDLQKKVATIARRAGANLPHRRFVPHITLARFPNRPAPEELVRTGRFLAARGDFGIGPFAPDGLTLYRSTLTDSGPVYDALADYPLI